MIKAEPVERDNWEGWKKRKIAEQRKKPTKGMYDVDGSRLTEL